MKSGLSNLLEQRTLLAILSGGLLVAAIIVGGVMFQVGQSSSTPPPPTAIAAQPTNPPPVIVTNTPTSNPTATPTPQSTPTPTITPSPTPLVSLNQMTNLGRLETTEFTMQTVIDLEKDEEGLWDKIFGTDRLMLVAEGEVVAGIDLKQLTEDDIILDGKKIVILLPPTEILYSRIDNEKTFVYERNVGPLVIPDKELESRARQLAEERLTEWAIERGIHDKAQQNARLQMENLLRSLGFEDITITFKEKPI